MANLSTTIKEKNCPFVSVLLAAYKTDERYLRQCLDSVLKQTYRNFELLIWDDCPTDNRVEEIVRSYSDSRVRYYHQTKSRGIAENRNDLMTAAKGKYFAVMDHDDVMDPKRLESQVTYMEANQEVGICGTSYKCFGLWNKRGTVRLPEGSDDIKAGLFFKCMMLHPSIMLRASLIKKYKIVYNADYISANDRHLYLDMMPYTEFHNLPEALMNYRMHKNMTSRTRREAIQAEQRHLREEMLEKMGAELSEKELLILNDYILKGRCRIKKRDALMQVAVVLEKLDVANQKSGYFPKKAFSKFCAKYLVKRCLNAVVYGWIPSNKLLKQTQLPVSKVKEPVLLKIFNFFADLLSK